MYLEGYIDHNLIDILLEHNDSFRSCGYVCLSVTISTEVRVPTGWKGIGNVSLGLTLLHPLSDTLSVVLQMGATFTI